MPPKDKRGAVKPRDTAKMPRNSAEDALYRLTHAGDLFKEQVLARLDLTDRGMLRLANRDLRRVVRTCNSDRQTWTFKVSDFVGSVERFEWAVKNKILEFALESAYSNREGRFKNAVIEGRQFRCAEACVACSRLCTRTCGATPTALRTCGASRFACVESSSSSSLLPHSPPPA